MDILMNAAVLWGSVLTSGVLSVGAIVWTGFTYFDQRRMKKEMEKVRFLNQQDLETFKLYTKQKNESIVTLYEAVRNEIGALLDLNRMIEIPGFDFYNGTEEDFVYYLKSRNVIPEDSKILLEEFREMKNRKKNFCTVEMADAMYCARFNSHLPAYNKMWESVNGARLYIKDENFGKLQTLAEKIESLIVRDCNPAFRGVIKSSPQERAGERGKKLWETSKGLQEEFEKDIVPLLKKELWDETKNGK